MTIAKYCIAIYSIRRLVAFFAVPRAVLLVSVVKNQMAQLHPFINCGETKNYPSAKITAPRGKRLLCHNISSAVKSQCVTTCARFSLVSSQWHFCQ